MWWHFVTVLIQVVVMSVTAAGLEEQFVLASDVVSHLFSQCMDDMNTVEGDLYSIRVEGDIEYVRFDASGSNRTISWETESDIQGTVGCAFKAGERGAFMFKFTRSAGCELALDDAYDRTQTQATCEGTEIVYMANENSCMTDDKVYGEGDPTDDICPRNCTENGLVALTSVEGLSLADLSVAVAFDDPADAPTVKTPGHFISLCQIYELCLENDLVLPNLSNDKHIVALNYLSDSQGYSGTLSPTGIWMDLYKDDSGVWRHMTSNETADDSFWGSGEPSDAGRCAGWTSNKYLIATSCDASMPAICLSA